MKMKMKMKINTNKHIPLRTCIICRDTKNKRQLTRLVCDTSGSVQIDTNGKKPGRGAYLCNMPECWQGAVSGDRLERALRTAITRESREQLAEYGNNLIVDC
jgi:predicted RNA-binding protein YlxR (DUF448 family)